MGTGITATRATEPDRTAAGQSQSGCPAEEDQSGCDRPGSSSGAGRAADAAVATAQGGSHRTGDICGHRFDRDGDHCVDHLERAADSGRGGGIEHAPYRTRRINPLDVN